MNPFLISLESRTIDDELKIDKGPRVRIEDNVGESIHIHYQSWKIRLSVDEFHELASEFINAKKQLEEQNGRS